MFSLLDMCHTVVLSLGSLDTQKQMFLKQVYEKEDAAASRSAQKDPLTTMLEKDGLTPYQIQLLEKVRRVNSEPIRAEPQVSKRDSEQIAASVEIHKRINPGYVDMPMVSTNTAAFKYVPPPDFTREYAKADSDCGFQKYLDAAILKHVDLKSTAH